MTSLQTNTAVSLKTRNHIPDILSYSEIGGTHPKNPSVRASIVGRAERLLNIPRHGIKNQTIAHEVYGTELVVLDISGQSEQEVRYEFSRILQDANIRTIRFDRHMDIAKKRILANILAKNYPLIEVLRLVPGNNVVNMSFSGIKKLNDTYGQAFVDHLLFASKEKIMQSVEMYTKKYSSEYIRLVRDDYKNLTFSMPQSVDVVSAVLSHIGSKQGFLKGIIESDGFAHILVKKSKETGKGVEVIRNDILENFDFGIGQSPVGMDAGDRQKLYAFAEAELVSRDAVADPDIQVMVFDISRSESLALESVRREDEIIKKWEGLEFVSEGIRYPVITTIIEGKKLIHPELLRQVRKNGDNTDIVPEELVREIKAYIDTLNAGFDFIAPFRDLEEDLTKVQKISEEFGKGIIQRSSILTNFKGVMTKEDFMHMADYKSGMRVFMDIKDMGIQNLQSFQHLSRKIASGNMDSDNIFLGGKEVTDSFVILVNTLQETYPDIQMALGGDEVYLFFPGHLESERSSIIQSIHDMLEYAGLEARISSSVKGENSEIAFDKLDGSTYLHKMIETELAKKRMILYGNQKMGHETITLDIGDKETTHNVQSILENPIVYKGLDSFLQRIAEGEKKIRTLLSVEGKGEFVLRYEDGVVGIIFS